MGRVEGKAAASCFVSVQEGEVGEPGAGRAWAERRSGARGREEREEGGRRKEEKRKKEKGNGEKDTEKESERKRERFAAATAAGHTRAPVGCDARDEGKQGDGTAMDSDVGSGFWEIGQGTILNGLSSMIEKRF
jgi:hypothetical protein